MTRFMISAAAAILLASQADAQIVVNTGGFGTPAGVYSPFGGVVTTSGYYSGGYTSPYYSSGYSSPYNSYYGSNYYSPGWSGYNSSYYNTGYYGNYRRAGMYRGRGWRW